MRRQLVPLAAAAAALALASGAGAAPKACNLVVDAAHDNELGGSDTVPGATDPVDDSDVDITGADLATNETHVTAVVRTRTQRGPSGPQSPAGRWWSMAFTAGQQRYVLKAVTAADGYTATVARVVPDASGNGESSDETIGTARVVFDAKKGELRLTAPLRYFAKHTPLVRGRVLRDLGAASGMHAGVGGHSVSGPAGYGAHWGAGGLNIPSDTATSKRTYNPGTASCVAVGK